MEITRIRRPSEDEFYNFMLVAVGVAAGMTGDRMAQNPEIPLYASSIQYVIAVGSAAFCGIRTGLTQKTESQTLPDSSIS